MKMKTYTSQGPKIDSKIQNHMDVIVRQIKKEISNVLSIILAGSFGQGEGSARIIKGKIYPFNDYDIYIITEKKLNSKEIDNLSIKISNKLGFRALSSYDFIKKGKNLKNTFFPDLKSFSLKDLKKLLPRLRNYTMRNSTTVIYGKDYRSLIPNYKLKDIPLSEPAKLLIDRINQLSEYYSIQDGCDPELITYKIQTAYSTCATALLMLSQKFNSSYIKSMKILYKIYKKDFPELYKKIPDLHIQLKKYIGWKLNPKKLPSKNIEKELYRAINHIMEVSKYFFSKFLGIKILNEDDLSNSVLSMSKKFYKPYIKKKFNIKSDSMYHLLFPFIKLFLKYKYFLRVKKSSGKYYFKIFFNKYTPDSYISAATPYLTLYIKDHNKSNLNKLNNLIKKIYPLEGRNWEKLSLTYRKAYLSFFLQDLG